MLTRIAILNSKVYGKAELKFDDCNSLQLVGPNNIGKSTLIYALNFLFIVDGSKMSFSGQRKGDKETIHHYFPKHDSSFIVFEIYKKNYYCILVKRNVEGELEYYRFDNKYDDSLFFVTEKNMQRLLNFEEFKEKIALKGITFTAFKNKTEVFNAVYQRGKKNDSVVWLEDNVKTDGLSNNFSKVYRYLINSKLITNKTLKDSLIIADNRENEGLNFSQKNKKDITDLLKINDEIKNVKAIRPEFETFRLDLHQYKAKTKVLSQLMYAFEKQYESTVPEIELRKANKISEIASVNTELNEVLQPKKTSLDQKIGGKEMEYKFKNEDMTRLYREIDEINKLEPIDFLSEQLNNLDKKRREIELKLTQIEEQKLTTKQLQTKIDELSFKSKQIDEVIKNFNKSLRHTISDNPEALKILNSVLSEQVLSLPGSQVKKKVKKAEELLKIFDGEIDISQNIDQKDFKTVDSFIEEKVAIELELDKLQKLFEIVSDIEKTKNELANIIFSLEQTKNNIDAIKNKPKVEKEWADVKLQLQAITNEKEQLAKEQNALQRDISLRSKRLEELTEEKKGFDERIIELRVRREEVESFLIEPSEFDTSENLDQIYNKIKLYFREKGELKQNKDRLFDKLRTTLNSAIADEEAFVKYVEEEIACLHDKEKSIDGLLQGISTQFANPAFTLLKRYEEFKQFVYNKFNYKLSKTRISDIEALKIELVDNKKIMEEVRKISEIQEIKGQMMFEFDQSENLKVLNQYLDNSRRVSFDELFDIELHLTLKGATKKVDLSGQVESDGTDRMIRLIIIMSIINYLALTDDENKIVLFIDEVATIDKHNRPQLVNFCNEHNFIPIFAAPDPVPDFDKYYFIYPSTGKINVSEKVNAVHAQSIV